MTFTKPVYKIIWFYDRDGLIMGKAYEWVDNMLGEIKDVLQSHKYKAVYPEIETTILSRWGK